MDAATNSSIWFTFATFWDSRLPLLPSGLCCNKLFWDWYLTLGLLNMPQRWISSLYKSRHITPLLFYVENHIISWYILLCRDISFDAIGPVTAFLPAWVSICRCILTEPVCSFFLSYLINARKLGKKMKNGCRFLWSS